MLGFAPRGVNPICSNRSPSIIARARLALQAVITRLGPQLQVAFVTIGARFRVRNWSIANPWGADE